MNINVQFFFSFQPICKIKKKIESIIADLLLDEMKEGVK